MALVNKSSARLKVILFGLAVLILGGAWFFSSNTGGDEAACRDVGEATRDALNAVQVWNTSPSRDSLASVNSVMDDLASEASDSHTRASTSNVKAVILQIERAAESTKRSVNALKPDRSLVAASDQWQKVCAPLLK